MNGIEKAAEHIKDVLGETVTVAAGKRLGAKATEEEVKLWSELLAR